MSNRPALGSAREAVIRLLADGQFHSGEVLGKALGVSRAAVWKQLQCLGELGLELESSRGRGYRLVGGLDLIDAVALKNNLSPEASILVSGLEVLTSTDSSNKQLMDAIISGDQAHGRVVVAEHQYDGRGRRGRQWTSPLGANVCASIAWRSDAGIAGLEGLSLAVGVVVVEALQALGVSGVGLKWPNDIVSVGQGEHRFAKLGGILVEIRGDVAGECWVVVGVGLNMRLSAMAREKIGQPATDIASLAVGEVGKSVPNRLDVAAQLVSNLAVLMSTYQQGGFSVYARRWQALHAYHNLEVKLSSPGSELVGRVNGVDSAGALIVENDLGEHVLSGGEVSLRVLS